MFEAERLESQRQRWFAFAAYELLHPFAQGIGLQIAGVDVMTKRRDRSGATPFLGDGVADR